MVCLYKVGGKLRLEIPKMAGGVKPSQASDNTVVARRQMSFIVGMEKGIEVSHLDHLVLTVADIGRTCAFYHRVLGLQAEDFGQGRTALKFGRQKINLHQQGREFEPKAAAPTPGSADLCFIAKTPIDQVLAHLKDCGVEILAGPLGRTGATGPLNSVYIRDPDNNLIEIANARPT